ncbi:DNA repair protein RadA [Helicobacter sp. 12S02634-8]|uniref:DNA repair protein RadA n=1 Tax=Helicobacter sp. 12S02634-8 TaxID=1476199 RepID=UPI000BA4EAE4|nr:DNA repair protein RadA [Helicobacter sp. 12S02634-8]PAF47323.1 DNA repair protein RadA [Helicobacter sp. 12S02634-8]
MAKKPITLFECQHCGFQSSKWLGKCSSCGAWESLVELNGHQIQSLKDTKTLHTSTLATPITAIKHESIIKFSSTQEEFDIVLGGGIAAGGLYLIGGSPGVGKSTLLLKVAGGLAKEGKKVLYVSGEESAGQIKLRAQRLDCVEDNLFLLNEIDLNSIKANLTTKAYAVCIIDSIQTIYSPQITSAPGSISQVREITFELMRLAKEYNIAIFIIGHITKEGSIAGPRVLEHMVDTVLYFEGDPSRELRMLRGFKNRFGTTSEVGIFEMQDTGLISAKNASKMFFSHKQAMAGSAITVVLEGSRALVLEIQALVSEISFGTPKRSATGFDTNRLSMLLALLEKKIEIPLKGYDVFVNVTGGIKITETSADLAVIASILSSFKNRPLSNKTAFIGEVSLTGDIREVSNIDLRLKEMESYGFEKAILPKKPNTKSPIKCFEATEVTKILDWM